MNIESIKVEPEEWPEIAERFPGGPVFRAAAAARDALEDGRTLVDISTALAVTQRHWNARILPAFGVAPARRAGKECTVRSAPGTHRADGVVQIRSGRRFSLLAPCAHDMVGADRYRDTVPVVPPGLVDKVGRSDVILWEADWKSVGGVQPADPALLEHIAGTLYVVRVVWDLTPLERAVLSQ